MYCVSELRGRELKPPPLISPRCHILHKFVLVEQHPINVVNRALLAVIIWLLWDEFLGSVTCTRGLHTATCLVFVRPHRCWNRHYTSYL